MSEHDSRHEKDAPLRQDIRTLGNALGQAIQRHRGHAIFDTVERLRKNCRRLRECDRLLLTATPIETAQLQAEIVQLDREIAQIVDNCSLDAAIDVIRAFTVYFHLVNTAEQYHRIRLRRSHEDGTDDRPQHGSLAALIRFFQQNELSTSTLQKLFQRLSIELVFTAHPTEATRRSLITKLRQIATLLEAHDHQSEMTPYQRVNWQRKLAATVALLWRTDAVRHVRPQPLDEIKMGGYYLDEILYDTVPELYVELEQLVRETYL